RNGRAAQAANVDGTGIQNPRARQRAMCLGVLPSPSGDGDPLAELKELLRTAGVATPGEMVQVRASPDLDRYLGRGKLAEVKAGIARADANLVVCDDELAPRQERNLEQALGVPVIDRTAVILDIFADHAHSAEGKLQVELAQLEYNLARMRGLWTHLERLGGGIGTRGPGESQIETDRRLARDRIATLRGRLRRLERNRESMRSQRRAAPPGPDEAREVAIGRRDAVAISAVSGAGLDELRDLIETSFAETLREVELLVPYADGGRLAELHDVAGELEPTERGDGVLVRARVPATLVHRFAEFAVNGGPASSGPE